MDRHRALRWAFGALGLAFLVVAFVRGLDQARELRLPTFGDAGVAILLIGAGTLGAVISWTALFDPGRHRARLAAGFLLAQPSKYAPGGAIVQAAGQIGLSVMPDLSVPTVGTAFLVHGVVQLAAGATVAAALLPFNPGLDLPWRLGVLGGLAAPVVLNRSWLVAVFGWASRLLRRPTRPELIPPQRRLLVSFAWTLVPMVLSSLAFAILLGEGGIVEGAGAFAAGWSVGFAAIPFPSGLGVREAVLVALAGANPASVIAASVAHRLATLVAELAGLAVAWRLGR